jgi:hypothetical protein
MHNSALAALHVAAEAIRTLTDVTEATADNDHDSGEVIFSLINGESYLLKLTHLASDPRDSFCADASCL